MRVQITGAESLEPALLMKKRGVPAESRRSWVTAVWFWITFKQPILR